MKQLALFSEQSVLAPQAIPNHSERQRIEARFAPLIREELRLGDLVSYAGNKAVPVLRLYRYKEAFAFGFVEEFINRFGLTEKDYLFDPFCGMGTTLFAAMQGRIPSIGIDRLPVAAFVAQTLPLFLAAEQSAIKETYEMLKARVPEATPAEVASDVAIMKIAFPPDMLLSLRKWKGAIDELRSPLRDIFLLLFFSILEPCSYTSKDGQFLRLKREKRLADPGEMLQRGVQDAEKDILLFRQIWGNGQQRQTPTVQLADARDLSQVCFEKPPTALITSPPYANRYDYTRTYALELCFHFVRNFAELKALRFSILRSHIESKVDATDHPSHLVIAEVVDILSQRRKTLNNPRIPDMLVTYFVDMQKVIGEWGKVLAPGAKAAMVVDNVRFEGELVPVDLVLSEMAEIAGFRTKEVIVTRYKGNSSQQMGKYGRVPVRESIVIWEKS